MISDCRQVISVLLDAFWSFTATDFNFYLQNFVKSHNVYEFDRKKDLYVEKKHLELYSRCSAMYMVVSKFSKHWRKYKKKLHFGKCLTHNSCFENYMKHVVITYGLKHVVITSYMPHNFSASHRKILSIFSASRRSRSLLSSRWVKL